MADTPVKRWPIWVLLPLAILAPPILGIALVGGTPHSPSSNGSPLGLLVFPFVAAALIAAAATKAQPGVRRVVFSLVAGLNTVVWVLILFVGLLVP